MHSSDREAVWNGRLGRSRAKHDILPPLSPQDASARCLAVEPTADVLDRVLIEAGVKAARDVADVWRGQQVRQRAERMVERLLLLVKDNDGSNGDLLGFIPLNLISLDPVQSARI